MAALHNVDDLMLHQIVVVVIAESIDVSIEYKIEYLSASFC